MFVQAMVEAVIDGGASAVLSAVASRPPAASGWSGAVQAAKTWLRRRVERVRRLRTPAAPDRVRRLAGHTSGAGRAARGAADGPLHASGQGLTGRANA
jgi:hypothetical protein